ncbi:transmembrane amino acid transporter protein-domain-containing protein [Ilyonectria robusta]|uniref:transmembrane amino acid transporter protein-domain-containing protein n=1 Tax=Ilyonectria robusta TaxID=1079257 RepID=UPI001E8EB82F|nr:transmembrane amino acid transporter protein-domain-containing protein [Ilyonectria robusta]KAH8669826.1 transmembrane amino acid transporter protein-domain-containing protein [Ilyonectria robusta]
MPPAARNPTNWDQYDGRPSPTGSLTSSALAEEQALLDDDDNDNGGELDAANRASGAFMSRRRSSVTNHLAAIADIGGVNSFRSFARSWQRAAGFPEVIPRRPSFVYVPDQDAENVQYGRSHVDNAASGPHTSLLRQHLEASSQDDEASASYGSSPILVRDSFRERESKPLLDPEMAAGALPTGSPSSRSSIFAVPPHLATPSIIGSYGSHYGTIDSTMRHRLSVGQAPAWIGEDEEDGEGAAHGEHQPILVKEVKEGDKVVLAVEGQSTLPQSVFNSINAIIGVGLLSLPLAFRMSGWIPGLFILTLTAAVTSHTGKLLAKCMDYDRTLITYSDLAYVSFGARARVVVSALFTLELISANVALVILFADSLDLLLPGFATVNIWKCTAAVLVLMLNAMPLRFLSYTSVIGIFSTFCIVCIVVIDGLMKPHTPGSLREPAVTYLLPENWLALPLAYGLLASPWGAHSVFPSIYRDMRHPYKWKKAVNVTFSFSYVLDTCLAVIGVLMFGDGIREAITSNILKTSGYPDGLTVLMCVFIAIIPLTKIPLNSRPIITTLDVICGVHQDHHHHHGQPLDGASTMATQITRGFVRVFVVVLLLCISIVIPSFDSVCAFLGAALCTLISIILPISFHLKLFWKDISVRERLVSWVLLVVFGILGTLGTVWTFLPKHLIGAD